MLGAMSGRVLVVIAILFEAPAHADPFVMPPLALEDQASAAVDVVGSNGDHGVSIMLGYRRRVTSHVAVTAEAGVQGASRGEAGGWSLANITLGGMYLAGSSAVRVAATVPLASDDGDAAIPAEQSAYRVADGERFAARQGAVLLAGARRLDRAKAFAQVELGALALIRADLPDELRLRLGLAGGVRVVRRVALIGELTTVSGILSGGLDPLAAGEPAEDFRHALALGLRVDLPRGVLGLRLEVPLDGALRSRDAYVAGVEYRVGM